MGGEFARGLGVVPAGVSPVRGVVKGPISCGTAKAVPFHEDCLAALVAFGLDQISSEASLPLVIRRFAVGGSHRMLQPRFPGLGNPSVVMFISHSQRTSVAERI